jgi:hypothetical protein
MASPNHAIVGADKNIPEKKTSLHPEIEYPEKFYSCCKCFASEYNHDKRIIFHKICCYVYTTDGTMWMGYYDYSEPNGDIKYDDLGEPCSPDDLCCCCSKQFIYKFVECKCLQKK